jgi:hypothetical protein
LGVPPLMHTPRPARRLKPNADSSHDVELLSTALAPHHFWLLCTGIMLFGILSAFASAPDPDAHGCQITQALGNHTDDLRPPPIFTCAGSIGNQALAPDEGMLPTAPHSELLLLLLLRLIPGSPSAHCPRRRARRRNHRVCTLPTRSPRPHRLGLMRILAQSAQSLPTSRARPGSWALLPLCSRVGTSTHTQILPPRRREREHYRL